MMRDDNRTRKQQVSEVVQANQHTIKLNNTKAKRKKDKIVPLDSEYSVITSTDSDNDCVFLFDSEMNCIDISKAALQLFPSGTKKKDVIGKHLLDISLGLNETGRYHRYMEVMKTGIPISESINIPGPKFADISLSAQIYRANDGLGITVNFYTDSDELKQVVEEIREAAERYDGLVERTNDIIYVLDEKAVVTYVTPNIESIAGYNASEMVGRNVSEYIYREDLVMVIERFRSGSFPDIPSPFEFRLVTKSGEVRWVRNSPRTLISKNRLIGYQGVLNDITDHKQAEEALKYSEETLKRAQYLANVGSWTWNIKDNSFLLSEELSRLYGSKEREFNNFKDIVTTFIHPDDREYVFEAANKASAEGYGEQLLYRTIKPDGEVRWMSATIPNVRHYDIDGNPEVLVGAVQDITERKQADQVLRESEARYRLLADNVTDVIWTMDMNLRYTYISPSAERKLGYSVEESMAQSIEDYLSPESVEVAIQAFKEELAIEELEQKDLYRSRTLELEQKCKDGSFIWSEAKVTFIRDDNGKPIGILGVSRDITERRQAEEELRQSEEKYRLHFNSVNDVVFSYDHNYRITSVSPSVEKYLGYKPEELEDKLFTELNILMPESLERATKDALRVFADEQIFPSEYEFIAKDGTIHLGEVSSAPLFSVDGKLIEVVSVARDITERKRGEEALRESQEKLRTVFDSIGDGITVLDLAGNIIDVNDTVLRMKGYNREEVIGRFGLDFLPEKDHARAIEDMGALFNGEIERTPFEEYLLLGKDGNEIPCEASASLLRDGEGNVVGLISVERDLRERKETEHKLRESEERLRSFMESATDVFNIWDSNLNLIYAPEKGVKEFFPPGTKKEDILGKSLSEIVPNINKTGRYDDYLEVIKTGKPFFAEDVIPDRKFGERHISIKAFRSGNGMGQVITDITKKKQSEKQLQEYAERIRAMAKRLSEVEESLRHRTARELHDNVGQNLTALGINLNRIKAKLEEAGMEKEQNILKDSQLLIEQTTESIRDVMASLRPPVLEDYGILATLKWYGQRFHSRTGIAITVDGEEPDPRMSADIEIVLFRIYQEALTNISKHAKASSVAVNFYTKDGRHRLSITDNGSGFDSNELANNSEQANWGLVTMAERADSISAQFNIESTPGRGTRVIVEI